MKNILWAILLLLACSNAGNRQQGGSAIAANNSPKTVAEPQKTDSDTVKVRKYSKTAQSMMAQGLVDVQDYDSTIRVSLMYSRSDNFTGKVLYDDLREGLLHPKAAEALAKAEKRLMELRPDLRLIIFDATRPMSIQQKMWDVVKNTKKYFYVSNPARGGGMHNYGMAVDISICKLNGDTIPMGATVDFMGDLSHIDREQTLVSQKRMTEEARQNRKLLREVMAAGGFKTIRTEWWHFNLCTREEAKRLYKVIK